MVLQYGCRNHFGLHWLMLWLVIVWKNNKVKFLVVNMIVAHLKLNLSSSFGWLVLCW